MASPASIKGHPIHAMLVPVAIGLWVFALVADIAAAVTGNQEWRTAAFYAIGAGVAGALLAAAPGLIDLLSIRDPHVRRIGFTHMVLNLAAVVLFALNFLLRWRNDGYAGPILLTLLGNALISFSGWLGGELVYRHGVGVDLKHQDAAAAPVGTSATRP
jgi:uncharacterized membrane protein